MSRAVDKALRFVLTGLQQVRRAIWFVERPKTFGAHAIALTPQGKIVLVKLRYAPWWRVPGGGRREDEDAEAAALRELREEIGLLSHGEVQRVRDFDEPTDFKRDTASLIIARDIHYRPRWSWEVEQVREFDPGALPHDISPTHERWIEAALPLL
ncbi:MAG TPA: NUDIX domain-containing protein [Sphingomicrobium sp.]|nr:NUDIX domain-containing protein [Sphingomicrobium sp.]